MQSEGFSFRKNVFYRKKTVVETISVAITDISDVQCLDLYLINIFTKSAKAERYTGITFKLTLHCLSVSVEDLNLATRYFFLLDATLGAR